MSVGSFFGYSPCLFGRAEILVILGLHFWEKPGPLKFILNLIDLYKKPGSFSRFENELRTDVTCADAYLTFARP